MDDPYKILGVSRNATEAEIRAAYRKLAKTHHPDLNPGNKDAEERFKAISAANDLLSDPDKRARFDRGEIDASGAERPPERPFYRDFGQDPGRGKYQHHNSFDDEDLAAFFTQAFGGGRDSGAGRDMHYTLTVDFLDAANGAVRRLTLPDGTTLDVTIPAGIADGQTLRLKGKGATGRRGKAGDALIEIHVAAHPFFVRDGKDIRVTLPVTLQEAVLGARVEVPTVGGAVHLTIPPHSTSGTRLRLKGRGIAGGDQYVELKVVLPTTQEPELEAFLRSWTPRADADPRRGMGQ